MTASDWRIEVRDKNRQRVGQVDEFGQLDITQKLNDVSTWRLTLNRRNRLAADLIEDAAGILVYRKGSLFLSGYWTDHDHTHNEDTNQVIVTGVDDTDWLNHRLAYPDPNDTIPPYTTQAEDVRTAIATTVMQQFIDENGGLSTPVVRRIPGLFAGSGVDPVAGPSLTNSGRWQMLLPLLQDIAKQSEAQGEPVGFRVVQSGTDLLLELFACEDKSADVKFSFGLDNLAGFQYKKTRPTRTYAHVGGDGEGTARTIYEKPDSAAVAVWGRIEGDLLDSRNGTTAAELSQAADQGLVEGGVTASLSATVRDNDQQRWGEHFGLGDKVTVILDSVGPVEPGASAVGEPIADLIREVNISLTSDGGEKVTTTVGTTAAKLNQIRVFAELKDTKNRVRNLERR